MPLIGKKLQRRSLKMGEPETSPNQTRFAINRATSSNSPVCGNCRFCCAAWRSAFSIIEVQGVLLLINTCMNLDGRTLGIMVISIAVISMYTHIYTYARICIYVSVYVCMYIYIHIRNIYIYVYIYMYISGCLFTFFDCA